MVVETFGVWTVVAVCVVVPVVPVCVVAPVCPVFGAVVVVWMFAPITVAEVYVGGVVAFSHPFSPVNMDFSEMSFMQSFPFPHPQISPEQLLVNIRFSPKFARLAFTCHVPFGSKPAQ